MHAMHLLLLALGSVTLGMPLFSFEARATQHRSLINLSPTVSPKVHLGQLFGCLGIGISVCDPINVNGTQNSGNGEKSSKASGNNNSHDDHNYSTSPPSGGQENPTAGNSDKDGPLNIAPVISPDMNPSNQNSCVGLGVSVCNPINVNGEQNSNNY